MRKMPTYGYKCKNCNHEFEEFQPMSADLLTICPQCKTPSLVRMIGSGGGVIFKGSGFYLTDYKNSKSDAKASKPKTPAAEKPSSEPKQESPPPPVKPKEE